MKIFLLAIAALCVASACADGTFFDRDLTRNQARCAYDSLKGLELMSLAEIGDLIVDVHETAEKLKTQYESCEAKAPAENASFWQKLEYEACSFLWNVSLNYEMARLSEKSNFPYYLGVFNNLKSCQDV